jgi:SAM-dependent methyltransferase
LIRGRGQEDPQAAEAAPRLLSLRWDAEYRRGRYTDEPPIQFAWTVVSILQQHPSIRERGGLYVGCGNGRNYLPLVDLGLDLLGLDVSPEAIRRLGERRPAQARRLICEDFRCFRSDEAFSYLIAIQVFQHGGEADAMLYFNKVAELLRPGGLFFLRVNSAATEVYHRYTMVERNRFGGFTVRYEEGPKRGLLVHFYSREELAERTGDAFSPLMPLREEVIRRSPPQKGTWVQWEGVWQRK